MACTPETCSPLNLGFSFTGQASLLGVPCWRGELLDFSWFWELVHWERVHWFRRVSLPDLGTSSLVLVLVLSWFCMHQCQNLFVPFVLEIVYIFCVLVLSDL